MSLNPKALMIVVSQSGETADTLAALRLAKEKGPLPGCFSPFPHGTISLSVIKEYLGLEGGPPCFPRGFTCPVVLWCCLR